MNNKKLIKVLSIALIAMGMFLSIASVFGVAFTLLGVAGLVKYRSESDSIKKIIIVAVILVILSVCIYSATRTSDPASKLSGKNITSLTERSGSGDNIGKYGVIYISKEDFQKLPYSEIKAFGNTVDNLSDTYNYLTIVFEDGTGISYAGCSSILPEYGNIDSGECLANSLGYVTDMNTYYVLTDDQDAPLSADTSSLGVNGLK